MFVCVYQVPFAILAGATGTLVWTFFMFLMPAPWIKNTFSLVHCLK